MDRQSTISKVVNGFAWEGSTKLLVQIITWVSTILVARILSPEDYGIVAISGIFVGVLAIITDLGFMSALINQKDITDEEMDSSFWFSILISALLFMLLYYIAPFIAAAYGSEILSDIIRVSAVILPLTSLKIVPTAIAMRELNYKYRAITEMGGQFVTAAASILMAYNGFGVWTLVYSVIIGQTIVVLAYLPLLKHIPAFGIKFRKIRGIINYGMHLMFSQILEFFTLRADVFIISLFMSEKLVGYYSMGFHLATMPMDKIGSVFNRVGFPAISRIKVDVEESRRLFLYLHKYLVIITYPVLVGFMLIAEDLVVLFLTDKWLPVVPLIQVLCLLNLLRISGMIMPYVLAGLGHSKSVFWFQALSSIAMPVAFLVGAQYGLDGVLAGWFIVYPFLYGVIVRMLLRHLKFSLREYLLTFRSAVICTVIMFVAVRFMQSQEIFGHDTLALAGDIMFGAAAYILSFYLLFKAEFLQVYNKLKGIRS